MNVITTLLTWLNSAPWLNLLFLALSLLGVITSVILYNKSQKEQLPCYKMYSFTLIRNGIGKLDEIEITYQRTIVRDLTLTKFAFWNQGGEIINSDDVASSDGLRLEIAEGFKFLKAEISYRTNETNEVVIKLDKDKGLIMIDFNYLHTNQGFILEIYHTATNTEDIKFKGTIKSASIRHTDDLELNNPIFYSFLKMVTPKAIQNISDKKYEIIIFVLYGILLLPIVMPFFLMDVIFFPFRKKIPTQFRFLYYEPQTDTV